MLDYTVTIAVKVIHEHSIFDILTLMRTYLYLWLFVSELRVAFAMFDKDGDGAITTAELLQVMQNLGLDTSTEQVRMMIRKVDLDGNVLFKCLMQQHSNC